MAESSEDIARRVTLARKSQIGRQNKLNANLHFSELNKYSRLSLADKHWLEQALEHMGLSGRAWLRILRVARTIADLAEEPEIKRSML